MLGDRSTIELMVLMLTTTVCLGLLLIGAGITVIELVNPEADTSVAVAGLGSVLGTLLGAVLGLLAGHRDRLPPPPGDPEG